MLFCSFLFLYVFYCAASYGVIKNDYHEKDEGNGSYITGGHTRNDMPGKELEQMKTFKYLGAIIAQNGYCSKKI